MDSGKYGRYLTEGATWAALFPEHEKVGPLIFRGGENVGGEAVVVGAEVITHAWCMDPFPLRHPEADQFLVFMGTNLSDLNEFDAEIELCLGEEQERHLITKPTAINVPRGLAHCPLTFKEIRKPVLFVQMQIGNYTRLVYKDGTWKAYESIADERAGTEWELPE